MPRARLILTLTFLESLATILVERAVYFYCHERLGFSDAANLWLALAFGLVYVAGALASHRLSVRFGERKVLAFAVAGQMSVFVALAAAAAIAPLARGGPAAGPSCLAPVIFAGSVAMGLLSGLKWPVIESCISAGHAPAAAAKAVGRFNLSWAGAVPVALVAAGPLIAWRDGALFGLGAAISAVSLVLIAGLPARPAHLPADHPERPDPARMARLGHLVVSARWLMLAAYSTMWILATLMPGIFSDLKVEVSLGTALSGVLDLARLAAFFVLGVWTAWHGRRLPLVRAMLLLPAGFILVLAGGHLPLVLLGEAIFGWAVGEIYYAALYYAMVVQNASVEAGGGHESLIGLGFALGPAAGLAGVALQGAFGSQLAGILAVAAALMLVCGSAAARRLLRLARSAPPA